MLFIEPLLDVMRELYKIDYNNYTELFRNESVEHAIKEIKEAIESLNKEIHVGDVVTNMVEILHSFVRKIIQAEILVNVT